MARRRGGTPFDIMRNNGVRGGASSPPEGAFEPADSLPEPRAAWSENLRDLWDAGVPVVLRVPRGVAIMACVSVLGLLVLAYWAGYSQGSSATEERLRSEWAEGGRPDRIPGMPSATATLVVPDTANPGGSEPAAGDQPAVRVARDPRQVGLNYLILAMYPRMEAERLGAFLDGRGVETIVIPTDNGRSFEVVGLVGFTSEQRRAGEHREYERRMRQLGRDWHAFNNFKGLNLSDMYWRLFTGPASPERPR